MAAWDGGGAGLKQLGSANRQRETEALGDPSVFRRCAGSSHCRMVVPGVCELFRTRGRRGRVAKTAR